jgi:hypothetical protein
MFGFKKRDPAAKLRRDYERLMAEAVDLQRRGELAAQPHAPHGGGVPRLRGEEVALRVDA